MKALNRYNQTTNNKQITKKTLQIPKNSNNFTKLSIFYVKVEQIEIEKFSTINGRIYDNLLSIIIYCARDCFNCSLFVCLLFMSLLFEICDLKLWCWIVDKFALLNWTLDLKMLCFQIPIVCMLNFQQVLYQYIKLIWLSYSSAPPPIRHRFAFFVGISRPILISVNVNTAACVWVALLYTYIYIWWWEMRSLSVSGKASSTIGKEINSKWLNIAGKNYRHHPSVSRSPTPSEVVCEARTE